MAAEVVIIGGGSHGKVIADIVVKSGDRVAGFLDDGIPVGTKVLGFPVLGPIAACRDFSAHCRFIIALGSDALRAKIASCYPDLPWYTAKHPTAATGLGITVDEGCSLHAFSAVNPDTSIGRHSIVNTGAIVEHDCRIGAFCHIAPNAVIGGFVSIGDHVFIGLGSAVRNMLSIVGGVTIGAGSVVIGDITEPGVYVGCPVRKIR